MIKNDKKLKFYVIQCIAAERIKIGKRKFFLTVPQPALGEGCTLAYAEYYAVLRIGIH